MNISREVPLVGSKATFYSPWNEKDISYAGTVLMSKEVTEHDLVFIHKPK